MALAGVAHKAAALLGDQEYVRIAAPSGDADALAASTLLALALTREGVDFHFSTIPVLTEDGLARLRAEKNDALVLVDVPALTEEDASGLAGTLVLVHDADHARAPGDAIAVTAKEAGVRGGLEASASTLALSVALHLSQRNRDLTPLALAGALAEGQHAGGGLKGLNAEYATEAVEAGAIERAPGLPVPRGTLLEAVAQGVDPYFPGLAGRARRAKRFLDEAGVPADAVLHDLADADRERVASTLALRLLAADAPDGALDALAQPAWRAPAGPLAGADAPALARAVRAVAATGDGSTFTAWPWQREADAGPADAAFADLAEAFRETALAALVRVEREGLANGATGPLIVDGVDAPAARAVADLVAFTLAPPRRPVLVAGGAGGEAVITARASRALALRDVDLGAAFRKLARDAGGAASGNRASAIARVPEGAAEAFIASVKEAVTP